MAQCTDYTQCASCTKICICLRRMANGARHSLDDVTTYKYENEEIEKEFKILQNNEPKANWQAALRKVCDNRQWVQYLDCAQQSNSLVFESENCLAIVQFESLFFHKQRSKAKGKERIATGGGRNGRMEFVNGSGRFSMHTKCYTIVKWWIALELHSLLACAISIQLILNSEQIKYI